MGSRPVGGGSGIRTHGGLPHTRFPSVPIRPLSHPSRGSKCVAADGLRPGLNYQSFYEFSGRLNATGLGMQICCDDVDIDRLRAEAGALLAALGDDV